MLCCSLIEGGAALGIHPGGTALVDIMPRASTSLEREPAHLLNDEGIVQPRIIYHAHSEKVL
jgi:hypothetical protein